MISRRGGIAALLVLIACTGVIAKDIATKDTSGDKQGTPVTIGDQPLFTIQERMGSFTAEDRARAISSRLEKLSRDYATRLETLQGVDTGPTTDIAAGDLVLMTLTDQDAKAAGLTRKELAEEYVKKIQAAVMSSRKTYSVKSLALGALYTLLTTIGLVILLKFLSRTFPRLYAKLESWRGTRIPSLKIKHLEILPADRITDIAIGLARALRMAVTVVACYFYLTLDFSFFPSTREFGSKLLGYVLSPLGAILMGFVSYLPNAIFVVVIATVTHYVIKLIHMIFLEVRRETISLPGFYPEWADPTYKIVRFLIVAFAIVVMFPYLPGSNSPAFKGASVFLGVLFSLGSSSAVANVVAGVILTYMRAFTIGDRVKISDTTGDIIEKSLLVTRIRTIKNEDITIPNAMVLGSHIVNFSSSAPDKGLILHTTITIGYDAPWKKVHELMISAAQATENILKEPKPFVLQTSLDDFYVSYQINAYTDKPGIMARTYSALHQNIQDKFNEGGVEIMSPHYAAVRDGNQTTIPENHLPKDYAAPSFRVSAIDALLGKKN